MTPLGIQAYLLNCSATLALFFSPEMYGFTLLLPPLLCLVASSVLSYWAGQVLLALTDLSLGERVSEGANIRILPASEEQRRTVLDIPTLVSHNAKGEASYALALYFCLLAVVEMAVMCCSMLIFPLSTLWSRLAGILLFPCLASVVSLFSLEQLERLEMVLGTCRLLAMLVSAASILAGKCPDSSAEQQFAFLSVSLWLLNYHVPSPLLLCGQSLRSQRRMHTLALAIASTYCSVVVLTSYLSTNLTGATLYRTALICLLPIALLSTANIYLRTFSHLLCTWRYSCNRRELETRVSRRIKLIKVLAPWPVFLIYASVEAIFFEQTFKRFFLSSL